MKEKIGARLRRLRVGRSLSTIEVASRLGVAPSTYREWENGRAIRGEPYEKLALILGASLQEVLLGERFKSSEALRVMDEVEAGLAKLKYEIMKAI